MGQNSSMAFQQSSQPLFPRHNLKQPTSPSVVSTAETPPSKAPPYVVAENKVLPNGVQDVSKARKMLRPVSQELTTVHPDYADIFHYRQNSATQAGDGESRNVGGADKENSSLIINSPVNSINPTSLAEGSGDPLPRNYPSNGKAFTSTSTQESIPRIFVADQNVAGRDGHSNITNKATLSSSKPAPNLTRSISLDKGLPQAVNHKRQRSLAGGTSLQESVILEDPREHLYNPARNTHFSIFQPSITSLPVKSTFNLEYSLNLTYAQLAEYRRNNRLAELEERTGKKLQELEAEISASSNLPKSPFDYQNLGSKSSIPSLSTRSSETGVSKSKKKRAPAPPLPTNNGPIQRRYSEIAEPPVDYDMTDTPSAPPQRPEKGLRRSVSNASKNSKPPAPQPPLKNQSPATLQTPSAATPAQDPHISTMSSTKVPRQTPDRDQNAWPVKQENTFLGKTSVQQSILEAKAQLEALKKLEDVLRSHEPTDENPVENLNPDAPGDQTRVSTDKNEDEDEDVDKASTFEPEKNVVSKEKSQDSNPNTADKKTDHRAEVGHTTMDKQDEVLKDTDVVEPAKIPGSWAQVEKDPAKEVKEKFANKKAVLPTSEEQTDTSEMFKTELNKALKDIKEREKDLSKDHSDLEVPRDGVTVVFQSKFVTVTKKVRSEDDSSPSVPSSAQNDENSLKNEASVSPVSAEKKNEDLPQPVNELSREIKSNSSSTTDETVAQSVNKLNSEIVSNGTSITDETVARSVNKLNREVKSSSPSTTNETVTQSVTTLSRAIMSSSPSTTDGTVAQSAKELSREVKSNSSSTTDETVVQSVKELSREVKPSIPSTADEQVPQSLNGLNQDSISTDLSKNSSTVLEDRSVESLNTSQRIFSPDWTPEHDLDSDDDIMVEQNVTAERRFSEGFKSSMIPLKIGQMREDKKSENTRRKKRANKNGTDSIKLKENSKFVSIRKLKKSVHEGVKSALDSVSRASGKLLHKQKSQNFLDLWQDKHQVSSSESDDNASEEPRSPNWTFSVSPNKSLQRAVSDGFIGLGHPKGVKDSKMFENFIDAEESNLSSSTKDINSQGKSTSQATKRGHKMKILKRTGALYVSGEGNVIVLPDYLATRVENSFSDIADGVHEIDENTEKKQKNKRNLEKIAAGEKKREVQGDVARHFVERSREDGAARRETTEETVPSKTAGKYEREEYVSRELAERKEAERGRRDEIERSLKRLSDLEIQERIQRLENENIRQQLSQLQQHQLVLSSHEKLSNSLMNAPPLTNLGVSGTTYVSTAHLPAPYLANGNATLLGKSYSSSPAYYGNTTPLWLPQQYNMHAFPTTFLGQSLSHTNLGPSLTDLVSHSAYSSPLLRGGSFNGGLDSVGFQNLTPQELAYLNDYMKMTGVTPPANQQQWAVLLKSASLTPSEFPFHGHTNTQSVFPNMLNGPNFPQTLQNGNILDKTVSDIRIQTTDNQLSIESRGTSSQTKPQDGDAIYRLSNTQELINKQPHNLTTPSNNYNSHFDVTSETETKAQKNENTPTSIMNYPINITVNGESSDNVHLTSSVKLDTPLKTNEHLNSQTVEGKNLTEDKIPTSEQPTKSFLPAKVYGPVGFRPVSFHAGPSSR